MAAATISEVAAAQSSDWAVSILTPGRAFVADGDRIAAIEPLVEGSRSLDAQTLLARPPAVSHRNRSASYGFPPGIGSYACWMRCWSEPSRLVASVVQTPCLPLFHTPTRIFADSA
jgi:hypothetical protein